MMVYPRACVNPPIPEMGIKVGFVASSLTPHLQLMLTAILRCYGVGSSSTIDQHSLLVPINVGVSYIARPQPSGAGIIIPVGRVW